MDLYDTKFEVGFCLGAILSSGKGLIKRPMPQRSVIDF